MIPKRNIAHDFYQPDEPIVVSKCDRCEEEIYEGEICYEIPHRYRPICEDCINDVMVEEFENFDFSSQLEVVGGVMKTASDNEEGW